MRMPMCRPATTAWVTMSGWWSAGAEPQEERREEAGEEAAFGIRNSAFGGEGAEAARGSDPARSRTDRAEDPWLTLRARLRMAFVKGRRFAA